jgi:light-regulated signal transduction histidine kinase (bacteriophytochrome)
MKLGQRMLADEYRAALEDYLAGGGELALSHAYELGRKALVEGISLIELAELHHDALRSMPLMRLERAAQFLAETLAPFEMTQRGFREANSMLKELNQELFRKNRELEQTSQVLYQAKEAAETANRELEAFSYSVAHDLRAPLRSIDGFGHALLEDCADLLDDTGKTHLGQIRAAARRMAHLIDDLLRLSRVGRTECRRQPVDLTSLARAVGSKLAQAHPEHAVEFSVQPDMQADADPRLLTIVFENLISNAWKFTSKLPDAKVECGMTTSGALPAFYVRDNGAGFDEAHAAKLFLPFQRLHRESEFEGTGIGLAIVERVIRRHAGRIWFDAKPNQGATFFFTLAAERTSAAPVK